MSKDTNNKFQKMTDAELLNVINVPSPEYLEYQRNLARIELHKRQNKKDNRMLYMTAMILILTIMLVVFAIYDFFKETPSTPMPVPTEKTPSQHLNESKKKKTPQNKDDNKKITTHSSTSTKQK